MATKKVKSVQKEELCRVGTSFLRRLLDRPFGGLLFIKHHNEIRIEETEKHKVRLNDN